MASPTASVFFSLHSASEDRERLLRLTQTAFFRYFDSDPGTVSWVGSLLCGVYLMSGPIVGGLVNRFGCRPVCIAGNKRREQRIVI